MGEPKHPNKGITISYTDDRMTALVMLQGSGGPITMGLLLGELIQKGVAYGYDTDAINRLAASPVYGTYVEVAHGTLPKPGTDGRIEFLADGVVVVQERPCEFINVRSGTPIARRVPPVPGVDGMNVLGKAIHAPRVGDVKLKCGNGAQVSPDDPNVLLAEFNGVLSISPDGAVGVSSYMELEDDIAPVTGDVMFEGSLRINGTVHSGATIDVGGALLIVGRVEASNVKCGGDLEMRSPVYGASIECGGNVRAVSLEKVKMAAEGGVTVSGSITESNITSKGLVRAVNIMGGQVAAVCGIDAVQIGGECRTQTVVDVGIIRHFMKERDDLKTRLRSQNILTEGCISELYDFVRDNMGEDGVIPSDMTEGFDGLNRNFQDSVAAQRLFEEKTIKLEALLREARECRIAAGEVYPNVSLRLGLTEQSVKELLRNVQIKPVGVSGI